jgi:hypothetical protein
MSKRFSLFPPQPQKSYYPKGQRDSTANSLFQLRETNKQRANQYQLRKDNGKRVWTSATIAGLGPLLIPYSYTKKNSDPKLFKRIGTSNTYNDGTAGRLRRLKAKATTGGPPGRLIYDFNIIGGNFIYNIGNYIIHKFTSSGVLNIPIGLEGGTYEYIVVSGGGAGGSVENPVFNAGGGGGGGQLIQGTQSNVSAGSHVVTVGVGGDGSVPVTLFGKPGTDSVLNFPTIITSFGAEGGQGGIASVAAAGGASGGNSGGAGAVGPAPFFVGGGGGAGAGAGAVGGNADGPLQAGGNGGDGVIIDTTWDSVIQTVCGGGGGGVSQIQEGLAGNGSNGDGGNDADGSAGGLFGSGGGGGGTIGTAGGGNDHAGGLGGSGVVYIRYQSTF